MTDNNKTKHTPGPWETDGYTVSTVVNDSTVVIATLNSYLSRHGLGDSGVNGRLMAAAPELLEACQMAKRACEAKGADYEEDPLWRALHAAIAKAKAENG